MEPELQDIQTDNDHFIKRSTIYFLGFMHVVFALIIGYMIFQLWPIEVKGSTSQEWSESVSLFGKSSTINGEKRILLLVLLCGAIGSFIHSATSFSNFVGANKLEKSWAWWYVLRPFVGMSIALIFYLVFRGGLFTGETRIESLNIFGILTISSLTGLFSDRATLKLKEIFDEIFHPNDRRSGKLEDKNDGNA